MSEISPATLDSPADLGTSPSAVVKRWNLELKLSSKTEDDWRKEGTDILKTYRAQEKAKSSFNVLWSNTETLQGALYNSMPKPDVRRRFRDDDPTGKYVADVLSRSAEYSMDVYDFDALLKQTVLDILLAGRGVDRVRYMPSFEPIGGDTEEDAEPDERITGEKVECEHVQWDDFRHGPGKTWSEVTWVAFRHRMNREQLKKQFGAVGEEIPLDQAEYDDIKKVDSAVADIFKTLEVWEIWNKDDGNVLFIAPSHSKEPLKTVSDPLSLDDFFPCPRPIYAIADSSTLIPVALYTQYKEQAEELNRISTRINGLIKRLQAKGLYDASLSEMAKLSEATDGALIAASNVVALADRGGLDKFIWMYPIETIANVVKILMDQREACKAVIYEIAGIGDIMRAASDPQETFGAQKLKSQWGSQRLQRLQREFQRYVRDLIRLKCQVIGNKFQLETIREMTGIKLLTNDEKAQLQQQAQRFQQYQQAMQAQQQQAQQQQSQGQPQGMPQ
jgi:hypothetical protein